MNTIYKVSLGFLLTLVAVASHATLITVTVTGDVNSVDGTYVTDRGIAVGNSVTAYFVYDTDESKANSNIAGSANPGHEFSSFHEFIDPFTYGAEVFITGATSPYHFLSTSGAALNNNDISLLGSQVNNAISDGTYDWLELLGATTSENSAGDPINGEEWTLALFSSDIGWITDGSVIPDNIADVFTPVLLAREYDNTGGEVAVGNLYVSNLQLSFDPPPPQFITNKEASVPVSSTLALLMAGGLILVLRRKA